MLAHCKQNIALTYMESDGHIMGKVGKINKGSADIHL